jgi:aspartate/methionine/tyrosine aminotransferase
LCEPGGRVAVPVPSYPLFEHLAHAEGVAPVGYSLESDGTWSIDFGSLLGALDDGANAVVVVSPNNPTGSTLSPTDRARLVAECAERGVAIICDEVFADYASPAVPSMASEQLALTFTLNGLSKIAALPQMKLGWIVGNGPDSIVDEALSRLEFLADLYLSVATPVQVALPRLLEIAPMMQRQIVERAASNRAWLESALLEVPSIRLISRPSGWYSVIQLPRVEAEEGLVLRLLSDHDVLVHPGFFFDFEIDGLLIASLITPEDVFREGMTRVIAAVST